MERAHHPRPQRHAGLHPHAGRPHGLHPRRLQQRHPRGIRAAQREAHGDGHARPPDWRSTWCFESAFQMVADYPESLPGPEEFDFIKAVPNVWDETRVVSGRPGDSSAWRGGADANGTSGSITGGLPTRWMCRWSFWAKASSRPKSIPMRRTRRQPQAHSEGREARRRRDPAACQAGARRRPGDPHPAGAVKRRLGRGTGPRRGTDRQLPSGSDCAVTQPYQRQPVTGYFRGRIRLSNRNAFLTRRSG